MQDVPLSHLKMGVSHPFCCLHSHPAPLFLLLSLMYSVHAIGKSNENSGRNQEMMAWNTGVKIGGVRSGGRGYCS